MGAGSTAFTLQLVRDLVLIEDLKDCTLRLVDIHEGRLNDAKGVAELYKKEIRASLPIETYLDRRKALDGADYVICAVKIGGYGPGTGSPATTAEWGPTGRFALSRRLPGIWRSCAPTPC